jgi:ribosomal protein S18 acetylase RimI-like enzyme
MLQWLAMSIVELSPHHAAAAARLHLAGQPGTFLSSLGVDVLTLIYQTLPTSQVAFGFAALADARHSSADPGVQGFVSATTSTGRLFAQVGVRQAGRLLPLLLKRFVGQPRLAWLSLQTLVYPFVVGSKTQETDAAAELLSIMVEPGLRGRGIGAQLLEQLCLACRTCEIGLLDVTVAAENGGARRFYERHGFVLRHSFSLYGRSMCSYRLMLAASATPATIRPQSIGQQRTL